MSQGKLLQVAAWDYAFQMHLMPLLQACRSRGFEVICAGAPGPFMRQIRDQGYRYVELPFTRSFDAPGHLRCLRALSATIASLQIDLVHTHTLIAGLLGRAAARLARVPVAHTAHGFHFHEHMPGLPYAFYATCEWLGARLGDHLFVQNPEDRTTALALRMDHPRHIQTISSGIDAAPFDPSRSCAAQQARLRRELDLPPGTVTLLTIARPTREKGLLEWRQAIDALRARHPQARFLCVLPHLEGERHDVRARFAQDLPPEVRLLGLRQDIPALMSLSDIFVLPTHLEGLSRVTLEAMAAGLPVLTTDVRGCRGLVEPMRHGLLVPPGDVPALIQGASWLLEHPAQRRAMGEAGRARVLAHFGLQQSLDLQVEALLRLRHQGGAHARG